MLLCPNQHESRATDFCEVCGVEMTPANDGAPSAGTAGGQEVCPACHAEHDAGGGDFCEFCGYNFRTSVPSVIIPPPVAGLASTTVGTPASAPALPALHWELIVAVAPNPHVGMPDDTPPPVTAEQVRSLAADVFLIGRRSVRRQIDPDLSLDQDDGVSHRHAKLTRLPGGDFSLEDLGSSNGTAINGVEVTPGVAVTLKEGDHIALGRWTSLTVHCEEPRTA